MPTVETLGIFAVAAIAIIVMPGPSMIYILSRGITSGRRTAVATALGVESASVVFVAATAAGVATLIAASALALTAVRWAGVAYLVYLGVRALARRSDAQERDAAAVVRLRGAYREGLFVGLSNPKVVLFFLALFPQFVDPARGPAALQVLVLGAVFVVLGLAADLTNALLAGHVGAWLRRHPMVQRRQHIAEATSYVGLAVASAAAAEPRR